jgi:putative FmdB family regulatory protein
MPTYQYECKNCHHEFEQYQSIHDDALLRCPNCDQHQLFRVITGGIYVSVKKSDSELKLHHLADRNRDRLSNDEKKHLEIKNTPPGCKPYPKKGEIPFKNDNVSDNKLASLTKKQIKKYIKTGETP